MTSFVLSTGIYTFISTAVLIWSIISMWIIFKKAGRKGWESLIPVWNVYILFKIAGKTSYFWVLVALPILMIIYYTLSRIILSGNNDLGIMDNIVQIFGIALSGCYFIIPLICWLELPYGLTKKFGKSNWFYIGMLFLTPIFFGILAFSDAKYEGAEFNEKYSLKKWLLITLGISLFIGCCNAGIKYYQYKDFYDYFNNFEYDYKVSDENNDIENDIIENDIIETDINEEINEDYNLLVISDEVKNEIKDNTNSEESDESRVNYNDIKKDEAGYKQTGKLWIEDIVKDYKGNIIMGSDFVDETKDGFYSVYTEITKRTLYINDEYDFILMIGPEKIGYTMEISYNDINEPDTIFFLNKSGKKIREISIHSRRDCGHYRNTNNLWDSSMLQIYFANNDYFFTPDSNYPWQEGIEILTDYIDEDTFLKLEEDYCGIIRN